MGTSDGDTTPAPGIGRVTWLGSEARHDTAVHGGEAIRFRVGDVEFEIGAANFVSDALTIFGINIGDDDLSAFAGEATGNRLANTAGTPGHEGGFIL